MAHRTSSTELCETPHCGMGAKLQCPTCAKLGIHNSYFCSQECFKGSWKTHKLIHSLVEKDDNGEKKEVDSGSYNPWPGYNFSGKLRPYPRTKKREVPAHIQRPDYADDAQGIPHSEQKAKATGVIEVLNDEEIEGVRIAGRLGREVLDEVNDAIAIGLTTEEIDRVVHEACIEKECYPSPLNYYQFPKSCCTSVNEAICHGIPDLRPLQDGDLCNVDITVYHRGYHGDLNETFFVGNVSDQAKKLVKTAWECLDNAISAVHPGEKYREMGNIIEKHANSNGFSVVRSYCGHGIHKLFHCAPNVPHYAKNKVGGVMKTGHCFTIEPMINQGKWRDDTWPDKWTAVTVDGLLSAQFEQMLLVTENGVEVLTKRTKNGGKPYFMDKM